MHRFFVRAGAVALAVLSSAAPAQAFEARGSVEQVYATGLAPGAAATLVDARGTTLGTRRATREGGALFRKVAPGEGYRVRVGETTSDPLTVMTRASAPPDPKVHDQQIPPDGYGYLTMRDGTKLAYSVHPPTDVVNALGVQPPAASVSGPWPTLVEYSGYAYADPAGPKSGLAAVANLMGFAVVDVNMRGTGCSGGAFDYFEPLQSLDGYDVVEAVARQPWVQHGKVGMFGISYGGISQLFTAATQPPSLSAITPISVVDHAMTTRQPGGILNTGFALNWIKQRAKEALPAGKDAGQPYATKRIAEGDATCKANQALHGEAADLEKAVRDGAFYDPAVADPTSPLTFVDRIKVPTFLACQHTDEQTGGHCPTLAGRFTGTDKAWITLTNGTHIDALAPDTYNRLYDFLSLYVARRAPAVFSPSVRASAPLVFKTAFGIDGVELPPDPVQEEPTYERALERFERQPPVKVLFENGAGGEPGLPYAAYDRSFTRFPPEGTTARRWFLTAGGRLRDEPATRPRAAAFTWDAGARPLTSFTGDTGTKPGGLWTATPPYKWLHDPAGTAVAWTTAPLAQDTTVAGAGGLTAWVRTTRRNVDLQATISEVRPDGKEVFVQNGWLRTQSRKLDPRRSTELAPVLSLRRADVKAMPRGRWAKVTVPFYYQSHPYRKGSRIRLKLSAPNGDQSVWSFSETSPRKPTTVAVGAGGRMASRLVLPVVPGLEAGAPLPPCPSLRGQPCRDHVPLRNRTIAVGRR